MVQQTPDEPGSAADANRYLERLAEVAGDARDVQDPASKAAALMEAQQAAAWALRAGVALARQSGLSWRELAAVLDVPAATLHRQFQHGGGLFPPADAPQPAPSRKPHSEPVAAEDPARSLPSRPLNLFVGRERELADLTALLSRRRLITVWGPPGVGKTRLVLELSHQVARRYPGGVFWVWLAPLADADRIPAAMVAAIRPGEQDRSLAEEIGHACARGPVLLVTDNCEHLADDCGLIAQRLLAENPKLTIIATSRKFLGVPGEARVRVDPLAAVPAGPRDGASPAVRLFIDRARDANHDFQPDAHENTIADICTALDGLPLAIELAAQQCAVLPLTALRSTFTRQLDLVATGARADLRQHTGLRAAIAWSYGLLDETEQAMFRRLSILPDGADQLAAAALSDGLGLDRAAVWAILAELTAASMLSIDDSERSRFRMLESLREFGREQLAATGETEVVHELLLAWLTGRAQRLLASRARVKHRNDWAWDIESVESYRYAATVAQLAGDPRYAPLATTAAVLLTDAGQLREARSLIGEVLSAPGLGTADHASALMSLVSAMVLGGDPAPALRHAEQAYAMAVELGDEDMQFQARSGLLYALGEDDPDRSAALTLLQVSSVREAPDPGQRADPLNDLAWTLLTKGDIAGAQTAAAQLLALRAGDPDSEELHTCGSIELAAGNPTRAAAHFALALDSAVGARRILDQLEGLAIAALASGERVRALRLFAAAAEQRDQLNIPRQTWWDGLVTAAHQDAHSQLPRAEADAATAEGRALTLNRLIRYARSGDLDAPAPPDGPLTPRESDIARLLASGRTTRQIAARLGIGIRAVDGHVARARAKLGLTSRTQLAVWAAEHLT